jgi:hypothetical protein
MTHDELLAKVELTLGTYISKYYGSKKDVELRSDVIDSLQALRAVVELHKPKEEDGKLWCEHEVCYNHIEFLERDDCDCSYPCPTIQAIEKELG